MSKENPESGDVFMRITSGGVIWPVIVIPNEAGDSLGVRFFRSAGLAPFFRMTSFNIESLRKETDWVFAFNLNASELEEMIVEKYRAGEFNNDR